MIKREDIDELSDEDEDGAEPNEMMSGARVDDEYF